MLGEIAPLVDGVVPPNERTETGWTLRDGGALRVTVQEGDPIRLKLSAIGIGRPLDSLGLRFGCVTGMRRYLRNGYQSWDGSWLEAPGTPAGDGPPGKAPTLGFAMTALLPGAQDGAVVLGFERHDRFQTRFRFGGTAEAMTIDAETLLDRTGTAETETLLLFEGADVEQSLRRWSSLVAAASPARARIPERRIAGWCSWYNLYAAIDEASIREHLAAARAFRDAHQVPLDIFLIDDGFTPEMGDWLDVKPQFPRGMAPLLGEIAEAGFTPGLWIAPFLVGNRSRLAAERPDWLVQDRKTGRPLVHMHFYGEFRWHKRSEEYHVLDVTHPDAAAYVARVFRSWKGWGARYFKADFLLAGMDYGPDRARWNEEGLSRVAIWRRMLEIIRGEIGDDLLLGCGCPLWASVGLVDAVRIGRDIGVSWTGDYSAESLIRDLATRNHANGILWQADPDCVLLRDRFHEMSDVQVRSLALFAGLSGGVLMTSDHLGKLSADRAAFFAALLRLGIDPCRFPALGAEGAVIRQDVLRAGARVATNRFNPTGAGQGLPDGSTLPAFAAHVEGLSL